MFSLKNIFGLILCGIFLVGCGETQTTNTFQEAPASSKVFSIGSTAWNMVLPQGWTITDIPEGSSGVVMLAYRADANMTILQKAGQEYANASSILGEAQNNFALFQLVEQTPTQWRFKGKAKTRDPLRVFLQQVSFIPETNNYLYISCAYPENSELEVDCESLIESLGVVEGD